jgi:D-alanyl-D-alanine carboxypeptidase
MAYVAPPPPQLAATPASPPARTETTHTGWIVQVGALESESEARQRIEAARSQAHGLLNKADSFTEQVAKGDRTLFRARFAGLDHDQAETVCRTLKRSDISCLTVRN